VHHVIRRTTDGKYWKKRTCWDAGWAEDIHDATIQKGSGRLAHTYRSHNAGLSVRDLEILEVRLVVEDGPGLPV
jgi:hypothetical protein